MAHSGEKASFAPLYIHSFQLLQPHLLADGEKYNKPGLNLKAYKSTSEKLRLCRYQKSMLQSEVAQYIGIDRTTYSSMEEVERKYYPIDILRRIASLFEVDIVDLVDEYNLFLYQGQGLQIKFIRKSARLTQKLFAEHIGVQVNTVERWESDKMRMTRVYWERLITLRNMSTCENSSSILND